ncbi:hypothetical protein CTAYLR_002434 [Chrysophaeum taylorii]|uniref:MYND-type domain-containing protein n=1 Tax=Chrysophaeum taylorii TaxID=2483200 RepID=A0AAD7UP43_9STRA|nr:hypothetical protein CTAYLR_002434 [Chrysophaeum taylorii]
MGCEAPGTLRCSRCSKATYCSSACQKRHWRAGHKRVCRSSIAKAARPESMECPICMESLVQEASFTYKECCGGRQCKNCTIRQFSTAGSRRDTLQRCAFCRAPIASSPDEFESRLLRRHKTGDATGSFMLYVCYTRGRFGVERKPTLGLEMLRAAASRGHPEGLYDLATARFTGTLRFADDPLAIHVGQDFEAAVKLYDRCLELGTCRNHGAALLNRGAIAYQMFDFVTARRCYLRAAVDHGLKAAMDNLEDMYRRGHGAIGEADLANIKRQFFEAHHHPRLRTGGRQNTPSPPEYFE